MIILLGATGYVGSRFQQFFASNDLNYRPLGRRQVDYYNVEQMTRALVDSKATFVINCAGFTGRPNVDACEDDKAECLAANAVLPGRIAQVCERAAVALGHVSSGCIYTGNRLGGGGFCEHDPPNFTFRQDNCSFYSGCKALGEEMLEQFENCYLWRMRIPFDHVDSPKNYLTKLMTYDRLLDVRNSLSQLDEFVTACYECWRDRLPLGKYNLTNTGSVTTTEVVDLLRKHGLTDRAFSYFRDEREFMETAARTPRSSCVLDNSKAVSAGLKLSDVHEALESSIAHWQCNPAEVAQAAS